MVSGKLPLHLSIQPLAGFVVLAGWTMAIPAGPIDPMELSTLLTLIDGNAGGFGAAVDDGIHCFSMLPRHGVSIAIDILGAEGTEDLTDCRHNGTPSWWC